MNRRPDWGFLFGGLCFALVLRRELEAGTHPLGAILAGTGYVAGVYFLGRLLWAGITRVSDRTQRHKPESIVPGGVPRLIVLTDHPRPDFIGARSWCDGRRRPCQCGDRCCSCRHTDRPRT